MMIDEPKKHNFLIQRSGIMEGKKERENNYERLLENDQSCTSQPVRQAHRQTRIGE